MVLVAKRSGRVGVRGALKSVKTERSEGWGALRETT
jgi:hypothetical protein